jgi:hypothetical protein
MEECSDMAEDDFTVTKVGWSTNRPGAAPKERTLERFGALVAFLHQQHLTTRNLLASSVIDDEFSIRRSDLTDEGYRLMQTGYQRWLAALDRGRSPEDALPILMKSLSKIRGV